MQQDASEKYFNELATTSRESFLPYIDKFIKIAPGMRILEAGCGVGGNLLPFAEAGCWTVGVDIAEWKIGEAERLFSKYGAKGRFIASDFFSLNIRVSCCKGRNAYCRQDTLACQPAL